MQFIRLFLLCNSFNFPSSNVIWEKLSESFWFIFRLLIANNKFSFLGECVFSLLLVIFVFNSSLRLLYDIRFAGYPDAGFIKLNRRNRIQFSVLYIYVFHERIHMTKFFPPDLLRFCIRFSFTSIHCNLILFPLLV